MLLFGKKKFVMTTEKEFEKKKKQLAYAIQLAIGKRTTAEFVALCKLTDPQPILSIRKMEYKEFPDRELLRRIASNSLGRVSWQHLYDLCGYSERDPEEDRSWAKWVPERGSVYMIDLGWNMDSEQSSIRPAVVMQNDKGNQHSGTTVIIPISSHCKMSSQIHVLLEKELGFLKPSYCFCEQIRSVSKRRFFYNSIPYKITTLPDYKLSQIQHALEFELGFQPLMFNENEAFRLIKHIKNLERNIKVKKSHDLIQLMNEKLSELINYCSKYHVDHKRMLNEYDRISNYAYQAI